MSESVHYAWLDADDKQVSPTHRTFGAALSFGHGWRARWDRLMRDVEPEEAMRMWPERVEMLTRTGKPPAKLVRVIVRSEQTPLDEHEQQIVGAMMERV